MVKRLFILYSFFFVLIGCKPVEIAFQTSHINTTYVSNMLKLANEDEPFKAGKLFIAELQEDYINRDGIGEKTIINTESTKPRLGVPLVDKTFKLMIITSANTANDNESSTGVSIFLPAIFNSKGKCIGLGPALIGKHGPGELLYYKKLKIKTSKKGEKYQWAYSKKENEFGNSGIKDPNDPSKTKVNILFNTDTDEDIPELTFFRIIRILQLNDNRFGGNKPLVFDISSIFEDPDALTFKFSRKF